VDWSKTASRASYTDDLLDFGELDQPSRTSSTASGSRRTSAAPAASAGATRAAMTAAAASKPKASSATSTAPKKTASPAPASASTDAFDDDWSWTVDTEPAAQPAARKASNGTSARASPASKGSVRASPDDDSSGRANGAVVMGDEDYESDDDTAGGRIVAPAPVRATAATKASAPAVRASAISAAKSSAAKTATTAAPAPKSTPTATAAAADDWGDW